MQQDLTPETLRADHVDDPERDDHSSDQSEQDKLNKRKATQRGPP